MSMSETEPVRAVRAAAPRPLGGVGAAASAVIGVATLLWAGVVTTHGWYYADLMHTWSTRGVRGYANAIHTIKTITLWGVAAQGVAVIGGVLFLVWLHRARTNAELTTGPPPRWGAGWAVGAWFVPIANLVLPSLVVADVGRSLRGGRPVTGLVASWWGLLLAADVVLLLAMIGGGGVPYGTAAAASAFGTRAVLLTLSGVLSLMSAIVLAVLVATFSRPPEPATT